MRRKHPLQILVIFLIFTFILIPFAVSLYYGNSPFQNNPPLYTSNHSILNQAGSVYGGGMITQPANSYGNSRFSEINDPNVDDAYHKRKEMTFLHVFRDMFVLFIVAVFAVILDRMYGGRLMRLFRRR